MNPLEKLDKKEVRDLMCKCWMTHDAMWFFHCLQEVGIEKTNKINKAAVRTMAAVEARRLLKSLGYSEGDLHSFVGFQNVFNDMFGVIKADFMNGETEFLKDGTLRVTWHQCFAYDGVKKLGVIDGYLCGIFDRLEGWFEEFGLEFTVEPKVEGCMMRTDGHCYRDYKFRMPVEDSV